MGIISFVCRVIVVSIISGVANWPSKWIYAVAWIAEVVKLIPERPRGEPVWYTALDTDRIAANKPDVQLRGRLKNGDIYVGNLHD
jgi:hypothetical protein